MASGRDAGAGAGRGGLAVLGAKAYFIVMGLAQQTLLPRAIGLAGYGAFARVMAMANVVNNVVVATSLQGVSRAVASSPGRETAALRATLRVHGPLALVLAAAWALAAPALASFQRAPYIREPLAVLAGVTLLYGLYAPLVGALNGRKQFTRQAGLDVLSATLRTAAIVGLGFLWVRRDAAGETGAALGAVVGALLVLPIAVAWTFRGPRSDAATPEGPTASAGAASAADAATAGLTAAATPRATADSGATAAAAGLTAAAYGKVLAPMALAQLLTNLLMQADLTLLGRFLSEAALRIEGDAGVSGVRADEWVAVYRACQLFAFLPYQLLMSVTSVLFPLVARAHAEKDAAAVARYVGRGLRIGALAGGAMVSVVVALPGPCLALAYGPVVAQRGAETLRVLAAGQGAFALFGMASSVLVSVGRERWAVGLSFGATVAVAAGCAGFVPGAAFGGPQLLTTAVATSVALGGGLLAAGALVRRAAGAFVPLRTLLTIGLAGAATAALGAALTPRGVLPTTACALLLAATYAGLLVVLRELGRDDLAALRSLAGRRRSP